MSAPTPRPPSRSHASPREFEWPTWLLWVTIVGGWLATLAWDAPLPLRCLALAGLAAWYMSLQHELIHGHPTRWDAVNRLLGLLPLAVWYPYDLYKTLHLIHHRDHFLTLPGTDPESNYHHPTGNLGRGKLALFTSQRTVLGRVLVGPALTIAYVLRACAADIAHGDLPALWRWLQHIALAVALLAVAAHWGGIPVWAYLAASYTGLGLAMLRSLYEHRPAREPEHRIVINEAGILWRTLYLNNNYHAVHHAHPGLAWYRIAARYRQDRAAYLQGNGGFLVPGYGWLFVNHLIRPIDSPILGQTY
jgi:fatty acid desaturase